MDDEAATDEILYQSPPLLKLPREVVCGFNSKGQAFSCFADEYVDGMEEEAGC